MIILGLFLHFVILDFFKETSVILSVKSIGLHRQWPNIFTIFFLHMKRFPYKWAMCSQLIKVSW